MANRLFNSCRSPSAAAVLTPTTTLLASDQHHVVPAPAGAACCPRGVPRRRSQPSAPCDTEGSVVDYGADDHLPARGTQAYRWLKSSRWHVIEANTYATVTAEGDDAPRLKIDARRRVRPSRRRRSALQRMATAPVSWSYDDSGWFSTDDEERAYACSIGGAEYSTLVTSTTTTTTESSSTGASGNGAGAGAREEEPVALAGGFAVVKRSEDPRADFRRSMAEMVVGRSIYDADGLERLLRCFLALNDQRHRRDIVAAFGDVWEAVFPNPPRDARTAPARPTLQQAARPLQPRVCHP